MDHRLEFFHSFPRALSYLDYAQLDPLRIREAAAHYTNHPPSEKHLQAYWYDNHHRPQTLTDQQGQTYQLIHPGQWNQEAGPDFLNAQLKRLSDQTLLQGDAELHLIAAGWKQHGHHSDPKYKRVQFHITWHPGVVAPELLPPNTLQFCLQDLGPFNFDVIDTSAYPWEIDAPLTNMRKTIARWTPDEQENFLCAAGEERLRRKTILFADRIQASNPEQALYEGLLCALCYKQNKQAAYQLAQAIPYEQLRETSDQNPDKAYALLMGIGGLLPYESPDTKASDFIRNIWTRWWKEKENWSEQVLDKSNWKLSSTRPANQPSRRLMAAASLLCSETTLAQQILSTPVDVAPKQWKRTINDLLQIETQTFWSNRLTLNKHNDQPVALIGKDRAAHITTNAIIPWLCAQNPDLNIFSHLEQILPHEPMNQVIRQTAHALFGRDHSPKRYARALQRQGLMQIYQDYGLNN